MFLQIHFLCVCACSRFLSFAFLPLFISLQLSDFAQAVVSPGGDIDFFLSSFFLLHPLLRRHPLSHFISLAFQPTALIALNGTLDARPVFGRRAHFCSKTRPAQRRDRPSLQSKSTFMRSISGILRSFPLHHPLFVKTQQMPSFTIRSNAKPSLFAYPPPWAPPAKEEGPKITAVLSTAAKASKRAAAKGHKEGGAKKEEGKAGADVTMSEEPATPTPAAGAAAPSAVAGDVDMGAGAEGAKAGEAGKKKKEKEPAFEDLENPARVTMAREMCPLPRLSLVAQISRPSLLSPPKRDFEYSFCSSVCPLSSYCDRRTRGST